MSGNVEKCSDEDSKHEGDATCILYQNGFVYSSGADGKIKIWDKDLNLKKTVTAHEAYIYSLAVTSKGKLYSSSCDGTIKFQFNPLESDQIKELVHCEDELECLVCDENDNLYSGDDKGVVTKWTDDKIIFKFNLIEHVRSMAVEKNLIYTVRDLDTIVTEVMAGKSGKYSTKATIPGKSPLALMGPIVDGRKSYLAFATRDGKGITLTKNIPGEKYATVWTKEDCHDMIINTICGTDTVLYTGAWDGKVKKWIDIDKSPKLSGEVNVECCVNYICVGLEGCLYTASSDGLIRRIRFP